MTDVAPDVQPKLFGARVKRIDEGQTEVEAPQSPARALMGRLERGLGGHSV